MRQQAYTRSLEGEQHGFGNAEIDADIIVPSLSELQGIA
jgi:hypothetical protein